MAKVIDFPRAVEELTRGRRLGPDDLAVWGGEFPVARLGEFLAAWELPRTEMPLAIWEHVDRIDFDRGTPPGESDLLERARVFGPEGDLDVRRDGDLVLWRFIGRKGARIPPGFGEQDFWAARPDVRLTACDQAALLWGDYRREGENGGHWQDSRVGRANLRYPHAPTARVWVHYTVFSDGGQVAFVWWKELRDGPGYD
jgi:hypothetical protein